jgi:hypothetical protein
MVALLPPPGDQEYVSVPVPPFAVAVAVPSLEPQLANVEAAAAVMGGGAVMVTVWVVVHPLASVT